MSIYPYLKVLMKEAEKTPNVVKATNRKGLYEELEDIQKRLAVCEKALADYLETKRLAFPRFYFISSSDLLDILSKGNQPVQVRILTYMCTQLLGKLFSHGDIARLACSVWLTYSPFTLLGHAWPSTCRWTSSITCSLLCKTACWLVYLFS